MTKNGSECLDTLKRARKRRRETNKAAKSRGYHHRCYLWMMAIRFTSSNKKKNVERKRKIMNNRATAMVAIAAAAVATERISDFPSPFPGNNRKGREKNGGENGTQLFLSLSLLPILRPTAALTETTLPPSLSVVCVRVCLSVRAQRTNRIQPKERNIHTYEDSLNFCCRCHRYRCASSLSCTRR